MMLFQPQYRLVWLFLALMCNLAQHVCMKCVSKKTDILLQGGSWLKRSSLFLQEPSVWVLIVSAPLGYMTWTCFLKHTPLSQAVPMTSINYVITFFIGVTFFGETFSTIRLIGILLIILGIFFVFHNPCQET